MEVVQNCRVDFDFSWRAWPLFLVLFGVVRLIERSDRSSGLWLIAIGLYALASAVSALFHGGRPLSAGPAVIYGALAAIMWHSGRTEPAEDLKVGNPLRGSLPAAAAIA